MSTTTSIPASEQVPGSPGPLTIHHGDESEPFWLNLRTFQDGTP